MKLRLLLAGLLLAASAVSAPSAMAQAAYVGVSGGASFFHDSDVDGPGVFGEISYDAGPAFNVSAGVQTSPMRLEVEYGYKNADIDRFRENGIEFSGSGADVTVHSFMLNGYYDIKMMTGVEPFIGVGIGILNGELDEPGFKEDDTVFGYQLTAGASFKMHPAVNFDISYRFQSAPADFEIDGVDVEYNSSSILAGVRLNF